MSEPQKNYDRASKKAAYLIAAVLVFILAVLGIYSFTRQKSKTQNTAQAPVQQTTTNNTAIPIATTTPTSTPAKTTASAKLSYSDAIAAYPERFQFSQCQGTPATISVKKGTPVMLDNRDPIAHTIKADTRTFRLAGYDYTVFYPEVLGNLVVTCDGKTRVMLNVEK